MTALVEYSPSSESPAAERPRGLRIAQVLTRSDTIAGAQVHVRDLSMALKSRGHEVTVLVGGNGPFCEDLRRNEIPHRSVSSLVRSIDPVHDPLAVVELRRCFKELQPDLVATHSSKAGWLGRLAARSLGLPVTYTAHGWSFTPGHRPGVATFFGFVEMLVAPFTTRIITVSEHDRMLALRKRVGRADQITTVHYGVPAIDDSLWAIPERDPPHIVMVARFEAQKDHQTLLRALAELRALEWTLELIGDGPREARMRALAQDLGIADRVQFSGLRRDVADRLARAQIFALITNWEGFPISILEGMRAGLPVIASDVAGSPESVQDGRTGLIVPPRDVAATKAALEQLLRSSALRKAMGAAGRRRFEENYTFDKMVDSTIAVYRDATRRLPRS